MNDIIRKLNHSEENLKAQPKQLAENKSDDDSVIQVNEPDINTKEEPNLEIKMQEATHSG